MRWHFRLLAFWCGVSIPGITACIAPSLAAVPNSIETALNSDSPQAEIPQLETSQTETPQIDDSEWLQLGQAPADPENLPDPDDRFLQPAPAPLPVTPEEEIPVAPVEDPASEPAPEATPPIPDDSSIQIEVRQIEVVGSTVFDENDFAPVVQPFEGRSLTREELITVADAITQLYLDRGYITSRAVVADQTITDGIVQIVVVEGSLESIEVEGTERVNLSYVRDRVELGASTPLNQADLEDQLRLLRLDPLFDNVEASLQAGSGLGQSILTVRVTEADPFVSNFSIDNYSPPGIGSERIGIDLRYRSPTGLGDELATAYYRSTTGGSNILDFSYRVPLNPMNGTLQLRYSPTDYRVTDPEFSFLDIEGNSDLYEISFRQPLVRSPREEFALSVGFTHQDGQTFISNIPTPFQFGPNDQGRSSTSVIRFGQDYVRRDVRGAWALRSQFNLGVDLFDATINPEPVPDGRFFSWLGQAQRVQVLNPDNLLIVQADVQLTPDSLLPSQIFVIGGGQSIRGYRQNARSGDNGFRFSVENRTAIQRDEAGIPTLQLAPFAEIGSVWNSDDNPNQLPNQTFLAGVGLGLIWEPLPDFTIRLDAALPLVDLSDRGENAQDYGFYFSINFQP
ncbi:MAG: ShlB/FhaC/HecB family hemolysin secretion/activation protein [Leptolyngbyaceae cyanobacterium SM1_4_3]|nr:ShlB/FhaC/HecB family hemolysin secretion/activation protein [Leptolyngbyaceae cyanobacterium SM1_4_3]